jgi:gliding motility-associated-like protein
VRNTFNINLRQRGAVIALLYFLFVIQCNGQAIRNLVTNGSFEDTTKCPYNAGQVEFAKGWFKPTQGGSSDYFNSCSNSYTNTVPSSTIITVPSNRFGFQYPRTGNAYQGFDVYTNNNPTDYREYVKNRLRSSVLSGRKYCITFYLSCAEVSRFSISNLGYYFSNDSILNSTLGPPFLIPISPFYEYNANLYDTINWVKIESSFTFSLSYNFITIGNFANDINTVKAQVKPLINQIFNDAAYYYIDDVSIVEINSTNAAVTDTLVSRCFMDSVILGTDSTEFATYTWSSTGAGLAALSCTNCPNPVAKPLVTTKYYLTKQQCSATTMDSVTVVVLTPTTQANAGNDKTICLGDVVQIGTQDSLAFTNYTWQNAATLSCTNCAIPFANPNVTTTYTVQRTECANITTDTVKIIIDDCDPTFVLPNVFTPNGDEINDIWGVNFSTVNSHITNFKMSIYDRWGLLVYSTNYELSTPNSKWDGRTTAGIECSSGVYYYIITFEKNEEHILLKGHLSLFR